MRKPHPHEHQGELNIVPYLDIMVNLVMFMLMSMTGFVTFQMINVTAPEQSASAAMDPSNPPPKPPDEKLTLNVSISKRGFYIAATGGVLPGVAPTDPNAPPPDPSVAPPTIPLTGGCVPGEKLKSACYDFGRLESMMQAIKQRYPGTSQYFLAADRDVAYDVIVQTMDATRGSSQSPMFPDVAFAAVQ